MSRKNEIYKKYFKTELLYHMTIKIDHLNIEYIVRVSNQRWTEYKFSFLLAVEFLAFSLHF